MEADAELTAHASHRVREGFESVLGRHCVVRTPGTLANPAGSVLNVKGFRVQSGPFQEQVVAIGNRGYRLPAGASFDPRIVLEEPLLWIGNPSLMTFAGSENLGTKPSGRPLDLFWDGSILPPTSRNRASLPLNDHPFFRLHTAIQIVRSYWNSAPPVSLEYLEALRDLGPQYLQHGLRTALGAFSLPASLWPADWENKLVFLLMLLNHACGVRHVTIAPFLSDPLEQRVFLARLGHQLSQISFENLHLEHLYQMIHTGRFPVPLSIENGTLVIDAGRILGEKPFVRSQRPDSVAFVRRTPLPTLSQMVLDGFLRLAQHGFREAQETLSLLPGMGAHHWSSWVAGFHALEGGVDEGGQNGPPESIGFLRGGFGPGGAAQEIFDLILMLSGRLPPQTAMHVAAGFFHPDFSFPARVERTILPQADRTAHWDAVTSRLFGPPLPPEVTEELQERYDDAVEDSSRAIADWVLQSGLQILLASQTTNPHENPVLFPALLGAKLLVEERRGYPFPVVFRHHYFRDPEGETLRIPIWQDRHPFLSPHLPDLLHLVDGPANQEIAWQQMGIPSMVLPTSVEVADVPVRTLSGEMTAPRRQQEFFDETLRQFEEAVSAPRADVRRFLRERYGIPEEAVLLLSPSRINRQKRIDLVLQLMKRMQEELGDAAEIHLVVLGERELKTAYRTRWTGDAGETAVALEELSEALGLKDNIHFLGFWGRERSDDRPFTLAELMQSADFVCQMSEEETFGHVYLEAMAAGALLAMSNFRYPGSAFGPCFPVYRSLYAAFNVFVRYQEEEGINPGMVRRMVATLGDPRLRRRIRSANFLRIAGSPYNSRFTRAYFENLLESFDH